MKTILCIADLHEGAGTGLTHPDCDYKPDKANVREWKMFQARRALWDNFSGTVKKYAPYDAMIVNGDCIDGHGRKTGGVEQLTTDCQEQVDMAVKSLKWISTKKRFFTYGTPYHVGENGEDWEREIAERLDAPIKDKLHVKIGGKIIEAKHKISGSGIPHGRGTAIAREILWGKFWQEEGVDPKTDIAIRAHVHYFYHVNNGEQSGYILPSLQALGTRYGARECSGVVHCGVMILYIDGDIVYHRLKKFQTKFAEDRIFEA